MCFVFIWEQTATCATYSINYSVFITEMKSVYSAVRTGTLNKAVCPSSLKSQQWPCYLSRNDYERKIRARKQRIDIGIYSSVNRTITLWHQLPAEALATFLCTSHIFRKRFRTVIISEENWSDFEAWWRNFENWREVKSGEWSVAKCIEMKIFGEMCALCLIYCYVGVCMFCAVRCVHYYVLLLFVIF